jgi:hypothetical protein
MAQCGRRAFKAADAVLALINSQPRTPSREELAAVIAKAAVPPLCARASKHRAEWDAAMAACKAAEPVATDEEVAAANERVDVCAQRIVSEPVHGLADLLLLAEACYWTLWRDSSGRTGPNADTQLAGLPAHAIVEGGTCEEAMVALLKGVRDVGMRAAISLPVAPLNADRDKYLASDWHRIVSAFLKESARLEDRTDDARNSLNRRLADATTTTWAKPVRTWDDLIVRAAIAVHWNIDAEIAVNTDLPFPDNVISSNRNENFDYRALGHAVRGILDLAGLKFDADGRLI